MPRCWLSSYGTGMRRAELAGLDVADLDLPDGSILVRNGKRRKQRTVYLTPEGSRLVDTWLPAKGEEAGPQFCPICQNGEIPIRRMGGESVAFILRRRQEQTGSATFTPHDLRRTFVSSLLEAGVDVFTVQKLAGHAEPATTARYDRRGETAKRRAAQSLGLPLCAKADRTADSENLPPAGGFFALVGRRTVPSSRPGTALVFALRVFPQGPKNAVDRLFA
jgi:integrase